MTAWQKKVARILCSLSVILIATQQQFSQTDSSRSGIVLRYEAWALEEAIPGQATSDYAKDREQIVRAEATWVISGMVWGFGFAYTPFDKLRSIEESFEMIPLGHVDAAAIIIARNPEADLPGRLGYSIVFRMPEGLAPRIESYQTEPWKPSQGAGWGDLFMGSQGRIDACTNAAKMAVRVLFQGLEWNKPREVSGVLVFERGPDIAMVKGSYFAQARVRIQVSAIRPFELF